MKNNKGITLTSLVVYIALIFVVLAILMRITSYFSGNIKDMADVGFETEFDKLNLYLLDEAKQKGNGIKEIIENGTQITFINGNKYTYNEEDKTIYLNDTIKVCKNVENCLFEQKTAENGKDILSLTIIIDDIEKTENYVITSKYTTSNSTLLPSQYQQVEYIESTGTQYFDTGIGASNVGQIVRIELDFQVTEYVNNTWICGTKELECGFSGGFYSHFTYSQTSDYLARTTATGSAEKTTTNKAMLFARDFNGTTTEYRPAKVKIYSTSIYLDDELVRDFIPCYRKSDNVVGMYDLVNDVFYTNEGTGEFLKGENKDTIIIAGENQDFINEEDYIFNIGGEIEEDLLPATYQQVEYIESTGTQYIDTGVNGGEKMAFYIKFNALGTSAISHEQYFAGDRNPKGVKLFSNGSHIILQNYTVSNTISKSVFSHDSNTHTIQFMVDGTVIVDNVKLEDEAIPNNRLGRTHILYIQFS